MRIFGAASNARAISTGALITLGGLAQLAVSYAVDGWASGVLVNTGTASLLFVPLFLAQRAMEARVRATQEDVDILTHEVQAQNAEVRQTLEEMREAFVAAQESHSAEEEAGLAAVSASPDCQTIHDELARAMDMREVGRWGMRVHVVDPSVYIYARLVPVGDSAVHVYLEKRDGEEVAKLVWETGQSADAFMADIATELRRASLYPSGSFDPTLMFRELGLSLRTARTIKDRYALIDNMERAQEFVPPQWMIYDWGIGAWPGLQPYYIDRRRMRERDLELHMQEKSWIDETSFEEALRTARLLEKAGRIEDE